MTTPTQQPARSSQLSEDMFAPALERKAHTLFDAMNVINSINDVSYEERSLYAVFHEAGLLEDYLDLHGAASNKRFHLIREDVSGIKWVSQALSCLSLLKDGPHPYPAADSDWSQQQLNEHVDISISCLNEYLGNLFNQFFVFAVDGRDALDLICVFPSHYCYFNSVFIILIPLDH